MDKVTSLGNPPWDRAQMIDELSEFASVYAFKILTVSLLSRHSELRTRPESQA